MLLKLVHFPCALLIPPYLGLHFLFKVARLGVMNFAESKLSGLPCLWPLVCKWNSQQCTWTGGYNGTKTWANSSHREHSGKPCSLSSLTGTLWPLFSLSFGNQHNLFIFSWHWHCVLKPQRMSISIIFCILFHLSEQKQNKETVEPRGRCCLVSLMRHLTNQATKLPDVRRYKNCWWEREWHYLVRQSAWICIRRIYRHVKQHFSNADKWTTTIP